MIQSINDTPNPVQNSLVRLLARVFTFALTLSATIYMPVLAQDQLKPIGQPVQLVKVKEVRSKEVSYVKYSSQSGPTFIVDITTLHWLILQGDKDTIFFQRLPKGADDPAQVPVVKPTPPVEAPVAPTTPVAAPPAVPSYTSTPSDPVQEARVMKRVRPVSGGERYDITIGASFLAGVPLTNIGTLKTSAINDGNTALEDNGGPTGIFRFELYSRINKNWSLFGGFQFVQQKTDYSKSLGAALAQDPAFLWDINDKSYYVRSFFLGVARPFLVLPNVELMPRAALSYGIMDLPEHKLGSSTPGIPGRSNEITLGGAGSRVALGGFVGAQARVYLQRKNYISIEALADFNYATFNYTETVRNSGSQTLIYKNQPFNALVNGWYWGLGYHLGF